MRMNLLSAERDALMDFRRALEARFAGRLASLTVFGSRARGEGSEESDLDVLVVVDELTGSEARDVRYLAGDLLTRHGVLVAPLVLSREQFARLRARERRIAREIERDGISL